jgi:Nup85 Nucleoporin
MTGTLIAPLALLLAFFGLRDKGDTGAAVQHLSKLFRLSSMPREYIALLMAEMLPILDGNSLCDLSLNLVEKRRAIIGQKDLFEILAAVEDYVADEGTFQKGSDLLSKAISSKNPDESNSATRNWREMIPSSTSTREVVSLFRVKVTDIIAQLYTTN